MLTIDDGGLPITGYQLQIMRNSVEGFAVVTSYNSGDSSHILTVQDDGLEEGVIYTIRWLAGNSKGMSEPSDEILVALVSYPQAPSTIMKISDLSSATSIAVEWSPVQPGITPGGEILGYILHVRNTHTGESQTVFNGNELGLYDKVSYIVYDLTTSFDYEFNVQAVNFNGNGVLSNVFKFKTCVAPSMAAKPTRYQTTVSDMTIQWQDPSYDGGCPITGFAVYINTGVDGAFIEANSDNDLNVRNNPGLHQMTITRGFTSDSIGQEFKVKVISFNDESQTDSDIANIVLADRPLPPQNGVRKV